MTHKEKMQLANVRIKHLVLIQKALDKGVQFSFVPGTKRALAAVVLCLVFMLAGFAHASKAKQYEVGQASADHFTVTTTTTDCSTAGRYTTCGTSDSDQDRAIYRLVLADGSTHIIEHVAFRPDPLKTIGNDTVPVKYRIDHKRGIVSIDYIRILAANGKEGVYTFAYHDGLKPHAAKTPVGPAPVPEAK